MHWSSGRYRIIIHLENQESLGNGALVNERAPYSLCQEGISEAVELSRNRTSKLLRELVDEGFIKENSSHIKGSKRQRKVYSLTPEGKDKAKTIRGKIEETKVTVKTRSNEQKIKLEHIDSLISSKNPLLVALNNVKGNNFIDLTHPKKNTEDVFSGRKDELKFLQNRLNKVKDDGSSTILIKGKAGIGKTRLVNEFKNHVLSEGFGFLTGKGHYDTLEPYLPFKEAFDNFENSNKTEMMEFSYTKETFETRRLVKEAKTTQNLIFSETTENIRSFAKDYPMVIFIDDLQWVDKDSLMLFHYLTEKLEDVPILFIGAYRSEEINRNNFLKEVLQRMNRKNLYEELELKPLSWENTKEIVQGIIGRIDIPDDFIDIIHETSEGNPFFSKEFIKQMLEDDVIDPKRDKYPLKTVDIDLPEVVDDIIDRRIKNLGQDNLKVLQIGSIIGEEVPFKLINSVIDMDAIDILKYVDVLTKTGLWGENPDEDAFYFTHGLIHIFVYESIPTLLRKELHKRVAESIEELFEDNIRKYYSDLGFHYKRAELFSKAFKYFGRAGKEAKRVYAHEDALEMYDEALELFERADLNEEKKWKILEKHGDVNKIIGKYNDSINDYEKIPLEKIEPKYKQRIYRKKASVFERKGEFDKALETVEKGLAENDDKDIETCKLLSRRGFSKMRQGKYDQAKKNFLNALDISENFDRDIIHASIHQGLGDVYSNTGEFDRSINHLETALEDYDNFNDLHGKSSSLNSLASVYSNKGNFDKALENYERSLKLIKMIGDQRYTAACLNNIGTILSKKGDLEKSLEYYHESHKMWEKIGDQQGIAAVLINIGEYYINKGELDSALENLKNSLEISKDIDYTEGVAISLTNIGFIFLLKGDLDAARENYQKGLELSRDMEYKQLIPTLLCGMVEIHIREDNYEKALEKSKKALKISKNIEATIEEGMSRRTIGMSYRKKKQWDMAEEQFDKGREILKDIGEKKELAKLFFQYALLLKDMEEDKKKRDYMIKALSMFEEMGMALWIKECKDELS